MGLFSSLYTGAAGMLAQSQATAAVSTNIANSTTTGYKKTDIAFQELVFNSEIATSNSGIGTVTTNRILRADIQGNIVRTSSDTDTAVLGDGFFPVKNGTSTTDPFLYTRNGSFTEDSQGILRNTAGFALWGWQFDENGQLPGNLNDAASLVPIDIDLFDTQPLPTSLIELSLNLDSTQEPYNPHLFATPQELPVSNQAAQFSRTIDVFDSNGTLREVSLEFRRTIGPMANFTSSLSTQMNINSTFVGIGSSTPAIAAGDILQISDGTNTLDATFVAAPADTSLNEVSRAEELITVINNFVDGNGAQVFDAEITSNGGLLVRAIDPTATLDISGSDASVVGANGFNFVPDPGDGDLIYDPEASLTANSTAYPSQTDFPAFADTTTPNTRFWWEVSVKIRDPANPSGSTQVEISKGLINFDGNGSLNATPDANGNIRVDLGTIDFDTADAAEDVDIDIDITRFTQFAGNFTVITEDQNGAGLGLNDRIAINGDGEVIGTFTNGEQVALYKIPLVQFINANGLNDISGTAFEETQDSGTPLFAEAGTNGAGRFSPSSVENANVDIADEFAVMIVSQRGFGANSQVFQTVDEMTELLARLK